MRRLRKPKGPSGCDVHTLHADGERGQGVDTSIFRKEEGGGGRDYVNEWTLDRNVILQGSAKVRFQRCVKTPSKLRMCARRFSQHLGIVLSPNPVHEQSESTQVETDSVQSDTTTRERRHERRRRLSLSALAGQLLHSARKKEGRLSYSYCRRCLDS